MPRSRSLRDLVRQQEALNQSLKVSSAPAKSVAALADEVQRQPGKVGAEIKSELIEKGKEVVTSVIKGPAAETAAVGTGSGAVTQGIAEAGALAAAPIGAEGAAALGGAEVAGGTAVAGGAAGAGIGALIPILGAILAVKAAKDTKKKKKEEELIA